MHIKIFFDEFWKATKEPLWVCLWSGTLMGFFQDIWIGMSASQVGISIIYLTLWTAVVLLTPAFLIFLFVYLILIVKGMTFDELNKFDHIFGPKLDMWLIAISYLVWMTVLLKTDAGTLTFDNVMDAICSLDSSCYRHF